MVYLYYIAMFSVSVFGFHWSEPCSSSFLFLIKILIFSWIFFILAAMLSCLMRTSPCMRAINSWFCWLLYIILSLMVLITYLLLPLFICPPSWLMLFAVWNCFAPAKSVYHLHCFAPVNRKLSWGVEIHDLACSVLSKFIILSFPFH